MLDGSALATLGAGVIAAAVGWKLYRAARPKDTAASVLAKHREALSGKRVLITGACTGLGFELARAILEQGDVASVLFHGRSPERVEASLARLSGGLRGRCLPVAADLGNLAEVDALVEEIVAAPPDVIICCAGVATLPEKTLSADGYEMQFAVNHLSHFHLVSRILPRLSREARVVVVSSDLHKLGPTYLTLDMDNLNSEKSYSWFGAYLASKYCNVVFARGLAARGVSAVSASPGPTATEIDRYLSGPLRFCFRYFGPGLFSKSPAEGASTIAFCATAEVTPGEYYADCRTHTLKGPVLEADGKAPTLEAALWLRSGQLVDAALARRRGSAGSL